MVAIFPKLCLWRRSLRSNLGGIDPEKLYRITLRTNRGELLPQKRFLHDNIPQVLVQRLFGSDLYTDILTAIYRCR